MSAHSLLPGRSNWFAGISFIKLTLSQCLKLLLLVTRVFVTEILVHLEPRVRLQRRYQSTPLDRLPSLVSWDKFGKRSRSRCDHSIDDSFAFLDLNQVTELPSELLCDVEVIICIASVNEFLVEHVCQHPRVIADWVSSNVHVVVCAEIKVDSRVVLSLKFLSRINICVINHFWLPVSSLYDYLLSVWF